jgi:hypothetical protein
LKQQQKMEPGKRTCHCSRADRRQQNEESGLATLPRDRSTGATDENQRMMNREHAHQNHEKWSMARSARPCTCWRDRQRELPTTEDRASTERQRPSVAKVERKENSGTKKSCAGDGALEQRLGRCALTCSRNPKSRWRTLAEQRIGGTTGTLRHPGCTPALPKKFMVEKNDGEIRSRARYVTPRPRKLLQEWRTKIGNRITGGRMNLRPVDMAGEAKLTHEKLDQAARKISHGDLGPGFTNSSNFDEMRWNRSDPNSKFDKFWNLNLNFLKKY